MVQVSSLVRSQLSSLIEGRLEFVRLDGSSVFFSLAVRDLSSVGREVREWAFSRLDCSEVRFWLGSRVYCSCDCVYGVLSFA